jgi:uncharacterized membrane protein YciS (DUF1049 family)
MAYLTLIITIPLTLFALAFAASNSASVKFGLWPLDQTWDVPLSILGLGMLGLGFLSGAMFVWIMYQRLRFRHWQHTRKISRLEKELDVLNRKADESQNPADPKNPGTAVVPK